jgi:hypothetical protein
VPVYSNPNIVRPSGRKSYKRPISKPKTIQLDPEPKQLGVPKEDSMSPEAEFSGENIDESMGIPNKPLNTLHVPEIPSNPITPDND